MGKSRFVIDASPCPVAAMGKVGYEKSRSANLRYDFIINLADMFLLVNSQRCITSFHNRWLLLNYYRTT